MGFVGGFGVSLLKLSKLSRPYSIIIFLAIYISFFCLSLGSFFAERKKYEIEKLSKKNGFKNQQLLVYVLIAVTFLAFLFEAYKLKFIPVFTKDTPHAYSTFHIFMVHYITTLYSFIPAVAICNYFSNESRRNLITITISYIYVIMMSMLLVSRAQLFLSIVLSVFIVLIYKKSKIKNIVFDKKNAIKISITAILCLLLFLIITVNRAHDVEYLKGIFEMKNDNIPIFIAHPYTYIAQNFENLNYMIENIFRFTFGRRVMYPVFTLTFIKKLFPLVVDSPYYIIKEELSTVTLIYDFYYDFGLVGVSLFSFIIGYIGKILEEKTYIVVENGFKVNNYLVILFAFYSYIMICSFFQTYFSLTDTWVNIIFLTLLINFYKIKT